MQKNTGSYWQSLINLWQYRIKQKWQPRHLVILAIVGGTTLAVSSCAYISYQIVRGLILDNLKQNALLQVQQGVQEIDRWLDNRKTQIESIANSPIARTLDWLAIAPYLKLESERLNDFFLMSLTRKNGDLINIKNIKNNIKDRQHFKLAMAGKVSASDPLISRSNGLPVMAITAPIWSSPPAPKQTIGAISGIVTVERLNQVVSGLRYGSGSYAFALNSQGVPIIHPDAKIVGNDDKPTPSFLRSPDPSLAKLASLMVSDRSGIELLKIHGKWMYVVYIPLQEADWSIALVIPHSNLEKQLHALNLLALVVGGLLTIATIAMVRIAIASEQIRARAEKEALLNRLTGQIRASLDLDTILQTTVEEIGTLLHLERAAFGWYDSRKISWESRWEYCQDSLQQFVGRFSLSPSDELEKRLEQRESIQLALLSPNSNISPPQQPVDLELKAHNYLALPIRTQGLTLGYLLCTRATYWIASQGELELLQSVAGVLEIAITQSQLYSQTIAQVKLLDDAFKKLQATQLQLVQSEKMSSLGQLVAGIAHEINNPVSFIHGNLSHVSNYVNSLFSLIAFYEKLPNSSQKINEFSEQIELEFIQEDLPQILRSMKQGTERIRSIILSLRNFSRLDESAKKSVDIGEGLDNTLLLLQNRLKDKITVVKNYSQLPDVECHASQLNQVFMNLLANAIDALEERSRGLTDAEGRSALGLGSQSPIPTIQISTHVVEDDKVAIRISDNGLGIPADIKAKIFDPFFTTKPVGKGTGLGLAISYQIVVEMHGGTIGVRTPPEGGTEFVVEIPVKS